MTCIRELVEPPKHRGFGKRKGERKGSRRKVILSDGSIVSWWNGVWKFSSERWNTAVATSLNTRAMVAADERGRLVMDCEKFCTFETFAKRLIAVVGYYEFMRIVDFMKA